MGGLIRVKEFADRLFGAESREHVPPANFWKRCRGCGGELKDSKATRSEGDFKTCRPECATCFEKSFRAKAITEAKISLVASGWADEGRPAKVLRQWKASPGNERSCCVTGQALGRALLEVVDDGYGIASGERSNLLVPVPGWWGRKILRGFDPSLRLAEGMAEVLGWPVCRILKRVGGRRLAGKSRSMRSRLARKLFHLRSGLDSKAVQGSDLWIVDDLLVTGATSCAASRVLRRAGPHEVHHVVANVRG